MFHSTNLPLSKWFWAIYLVASDKGGISALRLSKQINVSWITASRMLRKIRIAMGHRTGEWLPWVHIAIGNLKAFLLGTYHGVSSGYLQEYLNEFCYRFNRRAWEAELPSRLLSC
ncbi:ISXO2-like transposase domain-containing protein [Nitrosomonas sp. Nm51]|nr:ISXO2-like transposase domain-containing protein [Nitrosomonas sp. Nm51]